MNMGAKQQLEQAMLEQPTLEQPTLEQPTLEQPMEQEQIREAPKASPWLSTSSPPR
jgi:hypothetical protein